MPDSRPDCSYSSDCGCAACVADGGFGKDARVVCALACERGDLAAAEGALGELRAEAEAAEREAGRARKLVEEIERRLSAARRTD
jgi:hypothetical protein